MFRTHKFIIRRLFPYKQHIAFSTHLYYVWSLTHYGWNSKLLYQTKILYIFIVLKVQSSDHTHNAHSNVKHTNTAGVLVRSVRGEERL
jgi:hypothetical protein